jgi:hypothetical protein
MLGSGESRDRSPAASAKFSGRGTAREEPGSFRDRNGAVFYDGDQIYRALSAKAVANWEHLGETRFFQKFASDGRIVATKRVTPTPPFAADTAWAGMLSHARIPFISYPYEWPFGMLKDAALLHLELMQAALQEGMILKDSSAYNVQWQGARPVFIDVPSFEPLAPGEPWIGYRQFCELFLYPLMLQAYKGIDFRPWLRGSLDGIPAQSLRPLFSTRDLVRPGVLMHVVVQAALTRRYSASKGNVRSSLSQAGFDKGLIVRNVKGLHRIIERLQPGGSKTEWADYAQTHSYDTAEHQEKRDFVAAAASRRRWRLVWDLGCNTGDFSRIAAPHADYVVGMDGDRMAIEHFYQTQKKSGDTAILPLVVNVADPSPSQGWRGLERRSLPERGRPELTLCLALIHHVVISANIPIRNFIDWLAGLGTSLVIEFVGREDEMVHRLLANKDDQYDDYNRPTFEKLLAEKFDVVEQRPLKGGKRAIYFAQARA